MLGFRRPSAAPPPTFRFPTAGGAQVAVSPSNRWTCTGCGQAEQGFTVVGAKIDAEQHAGQCHVSPTVA